MTQPCILGFDTSGPHIAAAVLRGDTVVAQRVENMARGQAERLFPLLEEVLAEAGCTWSDLSRIGVGIGPGNFTGIRISVSAARGLALSLGIPAVGVSNFDIVRAGPMDDMGWGVRAHFAVVPGARGGSYAQDPEGKIIEDAPFLDPPGCAFLSEDWAENIPYLVQVAASATDTAPPAPLYVRPADAAPSRTPPPVILDGDSA